jgi:HlyD family secretion protein
LTGSVGAVVLAGLVYAMMPQPVGVDVATVSRGPLRVTVDEDGQTRIRERYVISSPLSGQLWRIELEPGDEVQAGRTSVAHIEPTDPDLLDPRARAESEARVKAAKAKLEQTVPQRESAVAQLEHARREFDRIQKLHGLDRATDAERDEADLALRTATENLKAARFGEEIARFELDLAQAALLRTRPAEDYPNDDAWQLEIISPIAGRVLKVMQESATVVTAGTPLIELGDPADLEVVVDVLSADAVRIQPGDPVLLEHWGGDEPLRGTVRLVEPSGFLKISALGVEEQRVNVIIDLDDPRAEWESLGDAFRVEARVIVWEEPDVLQVPLGALFRSEGEWSVFVVRGEKVVLVPVEVGRRTGLAAQILSGLDEGERVVVHPSDQVADGAEVAIR